MSFIFPGWVVVLLILFFGFPLCSVVRSTKAPVKFWLVHNFLSPTFQAHAEAFAEKLGCELEFVSYGWPEWLFRQTEKQRMIWAHKILFLDVLFPLKLPRVIFVDADQIVRGDVSELWRMELEGKPYAFTPFCDSNPATEGFR